MRRSRHALAVLLAVGLAAAATGLSAAEPAGRWRLGKPHRLRVTHTTRVRIAEGTAKLQVWHAEPLTREWPGLKVAFAAQQPSFTPPGANETPTRSEGGLAWKWALADPVIGETDYVSTFELLSADRELKTSGLVIRWADLPRDIDEAMKGLAPLPTPNARVRDAAAQIQRKAKDVIDGLTDFARWVNQNVAYTPGVSYASDDLDAICRGGGGHCGHRATVYLALCRAAGIPARRVVGYALLNHAPTAGGVDDTNRHVWVQVNLPTLGWVEVEPAPRGSPFALSYAFVMCPFDLQSRFVAAVSKTGVQTAPIVVDTLRVEELR